MKITTIDDYKNGDKIPGILYKVDEAEDVGYGPGLKWLVKDIDSDRTMVVFTPAQATKRNKLGRIIVNLTGSLGEVDTDDLLGPVYVHFEQSKTDATKVTAANLTTRTPAKSEDVGAAIAAALEAEAKRDMESVF